MTLYYSLVFGVLTFEIVVFLSLLVPMPFSWKTNLFHFLATSPVVAKLQYGLKITFIFIFILFVDAVNRLYRVWMDVDAIKNSGGPAAAVTGGDRMEYQARKFYSQRNFYLTGFTLFLSLVLNRTYTFVLETLRLEAEVKRLRGDGEASSKLAGADKIGEIGKLKEELRKRDQDIETLKSQSKGLSDEYNRLGDQFHVSDGTPKKKV